MLHIKFKFDHNDGVEAFKAGDTCELTEKTRRYVDLNVADEVIETAVIEETEQGSFSH